jgi:hypothetical protein
MEITVKCLWNGLKLTPCHYCILYQTMQSCNDCGLKPDDAWCHSYVTSGPVTWTLPTVSSACGWAAATRKILLFPRATFKHWTLLAKLTCTVRRYELALQSFWRSNILSVRTKFTAECRSQYSGCLRRGSLAGIAGSNPNRGKNVCVYML